MANLWVYNLTRDHPNTKLKFILWTVMGDVLRLKLLTGPGCPRGLTKDLYVLYKDEFSVTCYMCDTYT
jgi:hypothetical protein